MSCDFFVCDVLMWCRAYHPISYAKCLNSLGCISASTDLPTGRSLILSSIKHLISIYGKHHMLLMSPYMNLGQVCEDAQQWKEAAVSELRVMHHVAIYHR